MNHKYFVSASDVMSDIEEVVFPFHDAPNTAVFTCCHILDDNKPVLYVSHDEEDGMWQFLCGGNHTENDARVVSLISVFMQDKSIGKLAGMPCGCVAEKTKKSDEWVIYKQIE